ncbi:MAG: hypothetical protein ACO1OQ_04280 [Rufibacter sp.]
MSCSPLNKIARAELLELERNGYSINLDSAPIKLDITYLDEANIRDFKVDKKRKQVNITRQNSSSPFHSIADLRIKNNYPTQIDVITLDGLVLDSLMVNQIKFEDGSIQYIRLFTQKDYEGKDFDELPQVKERVGNGILIIETQ